ncbi:MAG: hypothetical protein R3B96_09635 [Pirellulaceae bacterium]
MAFALIVDQVEGELLRGTLRYRREASGWVKLSTAEAQRCLQRDHPALLVHEPRFDAILPGIPMQQVARHHRAELRLGEIMALAPNQVEAGSLEHKLRHVVTQLTRRGVQLECIGVTGSLLLGAHGTGSDLDLVIRSTSRFDAARAALDEAIRAGELQPLDSAQWRAPPGSDAARRSSSSDSSGINGEKESTRSTKARRSTSAFGSLSLPAPRSEGGGTHDSRSDHPRPSGV